MKQEKERTEEDEPMLKPMDIHNKEFKRVMRGYDVEEVD